MEKDKEIQYNEKAFGLAFHNGKWGVMKLQYSLTDEVSSDMVFTAVSTNKFEAIERYKIMVSELFK